MKRCIVCGTEFEEKRVTAKYCSETCKKLAFQKRGDSVLSVPKSVVSVPKILSVPVSVPRVIDIEDDMGLSLEKDFGSTGMTADGIFIRDDITIQQVRNIRRLVEYRHGWPHRVYDDGPSLPYSTNKVASTIS